MVKYSDAICATLKELGYTHCFFLAGGAIMHILESVSRHFACIPVVHEIAAGIAAEYFNESETGKKAFALVTSGPGLTNIVSAISGAYLESRELLVIGGQVKTADLAHGTIRQRGIQELDGVAIVKSICKVAVRLDEPAKPEQLIKWVQEGATPRKGPVFLELPLDVSGQQVDDSWLKCTSPAMPMSPAPKKDAIAQVNDMLAKSERPVLLLGGGVSRKTARDFDFNALGIPVTTTWNGADRVAADHPLYFGRPNTWGQRYSNMVLQQADLVIALGTRLGMQQSGFNWQQFVPVGKVVHVDCDQSELDKGHPRTDYKLCADANEVLKQLKNTKKQDAWLGYCREIKAALPLIESGNTTGDGFISPYEFVAALATLATENDVIIPCSSGGSFTVTMQTFAQKRGQILISDKGLASMGYGLLGSIGASVANPGKRTIVLEGDGGFTQNLQELGTLNANKLPVKIFIFNDNGYASIRMTQRNYFNGNYIGCDIQTGVGIPKWEPLFSAYSLPLMQLKRGFEKDAAFLEAFNNKSPQGFIIPIDPVQTYWPKITSRVLPNGGMESNPLHRMSPDLPDDVLARIGKYLPKA